MSALVMYVLMSPMSGMAISGHVIIGGASWGVLADHATTVPSAAVMLGIAGVVVIGWLVWTAIFWFVAEWRWMWITSTVLVVPCLAYGIVVAWREQQPFMPGKRQEAWLTAVPLSVLAVASVVVLGNGWGTTDVFLLLGLTVGAASSFVWTDLELLRLLLPSPTSDGANAAKKAACVDIAETGVVPPTRISRDPQQ